MRRQMSIGLISAATVAAIAGLAVPAGAITIAPPSFYLWSGHNYGAGVGNAPGALGYNGGAVPTWAIQTSSGASQPWIDSTGRIYATIAMRSTPSIAAIAATTNVFGIYTATTGINNAPNLNLYQSWATGQNDPGTGLKISNNAGTNQGMNTSSALRVSGTAVGLAVQVGNAAGTGTNAQESQSGTGATALLQNNTVLYSGNFGSQGMVGRMARTVSVPSSNDWTSVVGSTATVNDITNYRTTPTSQFSDLNTAGTWLLPLSFATVGPNPALAPTSATATVAATTGNASALALVAPSGTTTVIARAGDLPFGVGGPQFKGTNNGVGGFYMKMNRNGQVVYDASFQSVGTTGNPGPGGATTANDSTMWIYTPGAGNRAAQNTQVYQESANLPSHIDPISGLTTSNGSATFTGAASTASINGGFSNAGVLYTGTSAGGDTVTSGTTANSQVTMISTVAGGMTPTWVMRQNDIAPGFSAASNVHVGIVGTSSPRINNAGTIALAAQLQSNSTSAVQPTSNFTFNQFGDGLITATGIQGNDGGVLYGNPNISGPTGLRTIARTGDLAPGFDNGSRMVLQPSSVSMTMNNAGDLVFTSGLTYYAPGAAIGVVGQTPAASVLNDFRTVVWSYNDAYGLVKLVSTGDAVEVETGVFKYVISVGGVTGPANGDGGAMNFNDNGQLVLNLTLGDTPGATTATSTSYVVLQVPAASTGSLALLGMGVMARRRRR